MVEWEQFSKEGWHVNRASVMHFIEVASWAAHPNAQVLLSEQKAAKPEH